MEQRKELEAKVELPFTADPQKLADALKKAFESIAPEFRKVFLEMWKLEQAKIDQQEAAGVQQRKGGG